MQCANSGVPIPYGRWSRGHTEVVVAEAPVTVRPLVDLLRSRASALRSSRKFARYKCYGEKFNGGASNSNQCHHEMVGER
jgi:hypothetical protein